MSSYGLSFMQLNVLILIIYLLQEQHGIKIGLELSWAQTSTEAL